MFRRIYNKIVLFGLILPGVVFACGPHFPNSYLAAGGDRLLLQSPGFSFTAEIGRIDIEINEPSVVFNPQRSSEGRRRRGAVEVELADLRQSLEAMGHDSKVIKETIASYQTLRGAIENFVKQQEYGRHKGRRTKNGSEKSDPNFIASVELIPELVPEEFTLYFEGVIYYRTDQREKAVQVWQKVLDLPAEKRHYKSTWAAYMIARSYSRSDNETVKEKARRMYQQVRQYTREGFADSLDLAATSYGDEAATYLAEDQYEKAIELYLVQTLTDDPTAVPSLKYTCHSIFNKHKQVGLAALVNNRMVREALLAYAITHGKSEKYNFFISKDDRKKKPLTSQQLLLDAIEEANLDMVKDADRLAAIAYRGADFERAQRWLDVADMNSLLARRIRAKLFLRDGKIKEAAEDLAFIARQTNPGESQSYRNYYRLDSSRKLHSELGSLYLSQKMYTQAVDALMKGGNWTDAAYIAERVLTLEELQSYVDTTWPVSMLEPIRDEEAIGPDGRRTPKVHQAEKAQKIRYLLARRLARLGQFQKARPYYPPAKKTRSHFPKSILEDFVRFTNALEKANAPSLSQSERADAFWTAAWLMRHKGMEMTGTELAPDWHIYGGSFSRQDPLEMRLDTSKRNKFNVPTQDEIDRAQRNFLALPDKRFHYRYFASDLAWEAAALMENEDVELARRLCLAGTWHRDRDSKHADVFYKSLVLRCGTTKLGKEADRIRWFPKIPDTLEAGAPYEPPQEESKAAQ